MEIEFSVRISQQEVRQQFYTSSLFALSALLLAIFLGLFMPPISPILIVLGSLLSYVAFKPFLKVRAQQKKPNRLAITQQRLIFYSEDQKMVSIPLRAIEKISYDQGIILFLKKPLLEPVEVLDRRCLHRRKEGDFFFEWFEPNVFAILNQEIR